MPHPKKIETVHVEILDNELCIYNWQRLEVHNLNSTAAKVWELCDGQTSPAQMAERLQAELDTPYTEELVWLTLARLEKAHLLQEAPIQPAGHKLITRRELLVGLGVAATLLPVISSIVAPGPVEAQSPVATGTATGTPTVTPTGTLTPTVTPTATQSIRSQTFNFTGAEQQFIVPAGVTAVTIEAFGAEGGFGLGAINSGQGGRSVATIAVTAGETLFVYVGGRGGDDADDSTTPDLPGTGGFNGGGNSGDGAVFGGGGGGGASDVRQGGNGLANRVVVAGGGGGGGSLHFSGESGGDGGDGGGTTGANGGNGGGSPTGTGGGGGTQSSGGAGGGGGGVNPAGANGSSGAGGAGGSGGILTSSGGGGGGGGYFGGGGGGSSGGDVFNGGGAAGGGGGSSFAIPTATGVTLQQGGRTGDGQVIISW